MEGETRGEISRWDFKFKIWREGVGEEKERGGESVELVGELIRSEENPMALFVVEVEREKREVLLG